MAYLDPILAERERKEYLSKDAAPYAAEIVNRVISNPEPCVLVLPTGAGKSTVIPYAFVQSGYRVMIAEPTVAMCANIVSSFEAMFPSVRIGRAFGRETSIPKDARLVVSTNGSLKERLLRTIRTGECMSVEFTDVILLDEVHMGAIDTHIIVTIWYYCVTKFTNTARMPRLLLSSATVGDSLYSRRFSPCVFLPPELLTKTPFRIFPQYASQDYPLDSPARYMAIGTLLKALHDTRPVSERILIFLPGREEMQKTITASGISPQEITFVKIWSESRAEDYAPINRAVDNDRLVILATPSADAGLTVIGLVHVIDSLLVKNMHVDPNGTETLITELASKQLARQRMGRVGRKADGFYYPMCTEAFFKGDSMPASYTLEINRVPLYTDIVDLVTHGVPVEEVFAIYQIPSLPKTIEQLLNWGLLRRSAISGELFASSGGNFMTHTKLASPRLAGVLYAWVRLGQAVAAGVILVHLIATFTSQVLHFPHFEVKPEEGRGKLERLKTEFIRKHYGRFLGPSDVHTAIRLWNHMIAETEGAKDQETVQAWCNANAIQWRIVKNTIKSIVNAVPRINREAVKLAARDAAEKGIDIDKIDSQSNIASLVAVDEDKVMPILRRIMEHVYQDQIATRSGDRRPVFVNADGTTIEPKGAGFTLQADPDSATPYPMRIVVIGQRESFGKRQIAQFIDVDDHSAIAKISTDELNEKMGIFIRGSLSRRTGGRKTH